MGKLILICCTNVGRYIIEEIFNNTDIKTELSGIVNLNEKQAVNKANYDSYFDLSLKYGIEIKYCNNVNDIEILDWIKSKNPDIILQSGWSQKFSNELLEIPKYGCIGEHPAPLPKGRGAACVNWAILTGEKHWGDTFFQMVEQYDKGDIYAQGFFDIESYDSVFSVYEKVAKISTEIVRKNIDLWTNGKFEKITQSEENATYYRRRKPEDGEIKDFNQTAEVLHNFIRAQTNPYPCAFIMNKGKKIKLIHSQVSLQSSEKPIGTVENGSKNNGAILITCADNTALEIIRVQESGKPSAWAVDWAKENEIIGKKIPIS